MAELDRNPQNVLDSPNNNTIFMVWQFRKDAKDEEVKEAFQRVCALVVNLNHSADIRFPGASVSVVLGIGYEAWQRLGLPQPMPKEFAPFEEIKGPRHTAVSTPGDLHFHIRADRPSFCYDAAAYITDTLKPVAESLVEVQGFRYWDGRTILGFVDGTENPEGEDRKRFGMIGDEDPDWKGCSYLFVQKYIHDMAAWRKLPVEEQEKVIGRSKTDDIEMPDGVKPTNSHSARANVGDDKKVVRDNMPFGSMSTNEMGTYFLCYANSFSVVKEMLTSMFIGDPVGNSDRILDFSTPKTGTLFVAPTLDMLSDWAG